ncbi:MULTISPECIES: hypothetical protein [Rhodopseudomonas]|uniref:Uncharacterized protein n=1 Tax=Rhodopseudomonas palustris TaxID=1076 RepID=A0A0D7EU00_RHOPL|nr:MULTISPECIES: hypothetical protein [Rhodopseudomonas]KIZ42912.1 hypothetical protein OO17_12090 [Rhodopseudomonas palustris]MDF3810351.1 hypothetical protein [Rhodopseudomonas sp. BAL398]WOK18441.1 hypothetical protein RBJ75_02605 [Rhodopseudomonas sp. BAL398]
MIDEARAYTKTAGWKQRSMPRKAIGAMMPPASHPLRQAEQRFMRMNTRARFDSASVQVGAASVAA